MNGGLEVQSAMLKQVISFGAGMLAALAFWRIVVLNMVRQWTGEQSFWTLLVLSCVAFIAVYGAARWLLNERRRVTAGDLLGGLFSLLSGIAGAASFKTPAVGAPEIFVKTVTVEMNRMNVVARVSQALALLHQRTAKVVAIVNTDKYGIKKSTSLTRSMMLSFVPVGYRHAHHDWVLCVPLMW
jgi:hypothetical protein